ncbi:MAG: pseudouridine synthase [Rhodocyclaceae bacterium]|nr:MAG: pseudouridine synthase [Rhodocyclaceae bacterium]
MSRIVLFNKPYGVLSQFTSSDGRPTLKDYLPQAGIYTAGRLDSDSEGLLILTDDGRLQQRISDPRHKQPKAYWVQVEGIPDALALERMSSGLDLGDFRSQPCRVRRIPEPESLWPRNPPIRIRKAIPTAWLEIELREGKNRQVRRMTAKVGLPTLRLIRWSIGPWNLAGLAPGSWREVAWKSTSTVNRCPDRAL